MKIFEITELKENPELIARFQDWAGKVITVYQNFQRQPDVAQTPGSLGNNDISSSDSAVQGGNGDTAVQRTDRPGGLGMPDTRDTAPSADTDAPAPATYDPNRRYNASGKYYFQQLTGPDGGAIDQYIVVDPEGNVMQNYGRFTGTKKAELEAEINRLNQGAGAEQGAAQSGAETAETVNAWATGTGAGTRRAETNGKAPGEILNTAIAYAREGKWIRAHMLATNLDDNLWNDVGGQPNPEYSDFTKAILQRNAENQKQQLGL